MELDGVKLTFQKVLGHDNQSLESSVLSYDNHIVSARSIIGFGTFLIFEVIGFLFVNFYLLDFLGFEGALDWRLLLNFFLGRTHVAISFDIFVYKFDL